MTQRIPNSYRIQDGCANCAHVFVRLEYENDNELYCLLDAPPRPPCMSIFMGEHGPMRTWSERDEPREAWNAWKEGRDVLPQGICDQHKRKVSA